MEIHVEIFAKTVEILAFYDEPLLVSMADEQGELYLAVAVWSDPRIPLFCAVKVNEEDYEEFMNSKVDLLSVMKSNGIEKYYMFDYSKYKKIEGEIGFYEMTEKDLPIPESFLPESGYYHVMERKEKLK